MARRSQLAQSRIGPSPVSLFLCWLLLRLNLFQHTCDLPVILFLFCLCKASELDVRSPLVRHDPDEVKPVHGTDESFRGVRKSICSCRNVLSSVRCSLAGCSDCFLSEHVVVPYLGGVPIVKQYPFTAERKMMSTLVPLDPTNPVNGPVRLYVTGNRLVAAFLFAALCQRVCMRESECENIHA